MNRTSNKKEQEEVSLYEEIKSLQSILSSNDNATGRRSALGKLCILLRDATVRNKISDLAIRRAVQRGDSLSKAQREAMSTFWSPVITSVFSHASRIVFEGKVKLKQEDISLPLSLLPLSDDGLSGSQMKLESTARLTESNVKRVLKFCFDMLEHDRARGLAEVELMNTMCFLCERVDYVAYFTPGNEILNILATVEVSLSHEGDDVSIIAAKIFSGLLQSCYELGIGLHLVVHLCLEMVGRWCKHHVENGTTGSRECADILKGVSVLLRFHPEQAIKPMARYGRAILSYAKRVYSSGDQSIRNAIHGYFLSHLIVNQEAGRLGGLFPGDLGNLGRATLTLKQLDGILSLLISSLSKLDLSLITKKRALWRPPDAYLRRQLELCARIIACSQRQYFVQEEWSAIKDHNAYLIEETKELTRTKKTDNLMAVGSPGKPQGENSVLMLKNSPWVQTVLQPLCQVLPVAQHTCPEDTVMADALNSQSQGSTQHPSAVNSSWCLKHPVLDAILPTAASQDLLNPRKLYPLLYIVAACAETFPSGKCWTSSARKHWYRIIPDDTLGHDVLNVQSCSIADMALIVDLMATLLEACGGSTGDPELQYLSLLCLIRLTEAHSVFFNLAQEQSQSKIEPAWRRVWTILFRSDLQYSASTMNSSVGTAGELVLVLLTEMVHRCCTDPRLIYSHSAPLMQSSFLSKSQSQLWALPCFSKASQYRSTCVYELVCVFLHRMLLSDEGKDNMNDSTTFSLEKDGLDDARYRNLGRRYRLLCMCTHSLNYLDPVNSLAAQDDVVKSIAACLFTLISGHSALIDDRTFTRESKNLSWTRSSSVQGDLKNRFCFTEVPDATVCSEVQHSKNAWLSLFENLWTTPIPDPGMCSSLQCRFMEHVRTDLVLLEKFRICDRIKKQDRSSPHADYVPPTTASPLRGLLRAQLKKFFTSWNSYEEIDKSSSEADDIEPGFRSRHFSIMTLWIKIVLSSCLGGTGEKGTSEMSYMSNEIALVLETISLNISLLCEERSEFRAVFTDLLQIFQFLNELSSSGSCSDVPECILKTVEPFVSICKSLLLEFSGSDREDDKIVMSWEDPINDDCRELSSESEESADAAEKPRDLLEDSDDDEVVNQKRATIEKRSETKHKQKRKKRPARRRPRHYESPRKRKKNNPQPPDSISACVVASILMALEPSSESCENVIDCLVGEFGDKQIDLGLAYHCLCLLSDKSVIFHECALRQLTNGASQNDESFRRQSLISMVCEVLDMVRRSAGPSSILHMFGFQLCAKCVRLTKDPLRGAPLNIEESKDVIELLTVENSTIDLRPQVRMNRLREATAAFEHGSDDFHRDFDSIFPKLFVIPAVKDLSSQVRRVGCLAVAAALRILSNNTEKIVKSILSKIPPIRIAEGNDISYQDWYEDSDLGSGSVEKENQVWEDALLSMQCGAVYSRAVVAGVSHPFADDMLYELVKIASVRPELEAFCFQSVDKIAVMLGYNTGEDLLADKSECLARLWLESENSFADIPLLLSAPSFLRVMLEFGQQPLLYQPDAKGPDAAGAANTIDVAALIDVAADEFVRRYGSDILPQILIQVASRSSSVGRPKPDLNSLIFEDRNIQEFCICLQGKDDKETIIAVLKSRLHDIEAYCSPMIHSKFEQIGRDTLQLISGCLFEHQDKDLPQRSARPHLTVRRILELSGKDGFKIGSFALVRESFSEAISIFIDQRNLDEKRSMLSAAGTSMTECFLYARWWLQEATMTSQKESRWSTLTLLFDLVFAQIRKKEHRQTQLGFGIGVLIDIILGQKLRCIRGKALTLLKRVLGEVFAQKETGELREELSDVCRRLVGSLMRVHEESQKMLVDFCVNKAKKRRKTFRESLGLLRGSRIEIARVIGESEDAWGWDTKVETSDCGDEQFLLAALRDYHDKIDRTVTETILGTYEVLCIIFDNSDDITPANFVGVMPPFSIPLLHQRMLAGIDPRFCVQNISLLFLERRKVDQVLGTGLTAFICSLVDELRKRSSWITSVSKHLGTQDQSNDVCSLTMSQWILRAELVQLEHALRRQRKSGETDFPEEVTVSLLQELAFVCGTACPESLRWAASRCLGELDTQAVGDFSMSRISNEESWIQKALDSDRLLTGTQAQAVKVLAEYLNSAHSTVSIAALDTLMALLATRDGKECWQILDYKTQKCLLPILSSKKRAKKLSDVTLPKSYVFSLAIRAGLAEDAAEIDSTWCWNEALWRFGSDSHTSFENWICALVPAVIECCYKDAKAAKPSDASDDFFVACQRISAVAPSFACAILPAIVLNLLQGARDANVTSSNAVTVQEDTWIGSSDSSFNKLLSTSFGLLLGDSESSGDSGNLSSPRDTRAIALAIETLDLLRRATQSRFLKSESHKRNSSSDKRGSSKGSRSRSQRDSSGSTGDNAFDHNKDLGNIVHWRGVPFGTVLHIDGDLIVRACISAHKYASALFYAELYFDHCFRGSGAIMQHLSDDFVEASSKARRGSKTEISGYFVGLKSCDSTVVRERALQSLSLLGQCFLHLHEDDAYQASQRQVSDLRYTGCDSVEFVESFEVCRTMSPSLNDLQRLDSISYLTNKSVALPIGETLHCLGLQNLLQSYINGMNVCSGNKLSGAEKRRLRDRWFESRLYGMKWDEALLHHDPCNELNVGWPGSVSPVSNGNIGSILGESDISFEEMGFHEATLKALTAYARDDILQTMDLLRVARRNLLDTYNGNLLGESSFKGLDFLIERLQSLNDIESLAGKQDPPDEILRRWGFSMKCVKFKTGQERVPNLQLNGSFSSVDFVPYIREIILRILRFKSAVTPCADFDPEECLEAYLWKVCSFCRKKSRLSVAEAALYRLRMVLRVERQQQRDSISFLQMRMRERLEEASLMESKSDFGFAIRLCKQVISRLKDEESLGRANHDFESLLVDSLIKCGNWMSKYKVEPARNILDSYHKPSAELAGNIYQRSEIPENGRRYLKAQIALARLASNLYDTVSARVKSQEWLKAGKSLAEREVERENCEALLKEATKRCFDAKNRKVKEEEMAKLMRERNELAHYSNSLLNEIQLAKRERTKTENSVQEYLCLAVESFVNALSISGVGEEMDMSRYVFRLIYLWLSNCSEGKEDEDVNAIMGKGTLMIPSFRFIPLTSQLFAQIDCKRCSKFQDVLQALIERMCSDHPYHCLVQLVSVCNGREVGGGVSGRNASAYLENMSDGKVDAATHIAKELSRNAPDYVGKLLTNYEVLMRAYIKIANAPTAELVERQQTKNISLSVVSKTERLDRCLSSMGTDHLPCVLTKPPPVRSGCDYGQGFEDPIGGERIAGFDATFSITDSGLHRPKIVFCQGTKGTRFRQLVKGEDEIRQDAVMEQVFTYVNELMCRRESDKGYHGTAVVQKKLQMVTYNIIPLSPASGVLEWVEHSTTFGDYILDVRTSGKRSSTRLGAHSKYYPGEWGILRCRQHYQNSPDELKRETFDVICKSFSPVFRYFFVERFGHSLQEWHAAKMRYTRSCAVSSIVGHILGIGDRHCNNILVSQVTGEVVHIDFGIVFEQGKLLTVPEIVPFRLTRNIVDGMGPLGTEGTFSRSAEATAAVLRENANALLTILSAIASDPLYRWSVSPVEARRRQQLDDDAEKAREKVKGGSNKKQQIAKESKSERNEAAELALNKISEKLQGYEDGTSGEQQSIEGQVQLLINSARDPDNLSVMFAGWAPWV